MATHIPRRDFIVTLGSAVTTWPLAVRVQQPIGKIRLPGVFAARYCMNGAALKFVPNFPDQ